MAELPGIVWRLVGNTPLVCSTVSGRRVCVKLEYTNPTGSHKDRIAVYMAKRALEEQGSLACVVEASSGNTAVSVAWVANLLGIRAILVVDREASKLKKSLVKAYGADIVEVEPGQDKRSVARSIAEREGCTFLDQYTNEANFLAHYEWMGGELASQLTGLDVFVMGVGTGGTITGVAARLREEGFQPRIVAVTPRGSRISGSRGGQPDRIEGLASTSVPELFAKRRSLVDEVVEVSSSEALAGIVEMYRDLGLLVGPSTGAAYYVVKKRLTDLEKGSVGLVVAADHVQRYPELVEKLAEVVHRTRQRV